MLLKERDKTAYLVIARISLQRIYFSKCFRDFFDDFLLRAQFKSSLIVNKKLFFFFFSPFSSPTFLLFFFSFVLFFSYFLFAKISIVFHKLFCKILRTNFVKKKCLYLQQLIAQKNFFVLRVHFLYFYSSSFLFHLLFISFPLDSSIFLIFLFCSRLFELFVSSLIFLSSYLNIFSFSHLFYLIIFLSFHLLIFSSSYLNLNIFPFSHNFLFSYLNFFLIFFFLSSHLIF